MSVLHGSKSVTPIISIDPRELSTRILHLQQGLITCNFVSRMTSVAARYRSGGFTYVSFTPFERQLLYLTISGVHEEDNQLPQE